MKWKVPTHAVKVNSVIRNTGIVTVTSAMMEVRDQRNSSAALPLEKNPVTIWIGECLRLIAGLDDWDKIPPKKTFAPSEDQTPDRYFTYDWYFVWYDFIWYDMIW
jgi:hypothetical protein